MPDSGVSREAPRPDIKEVHEMSAKCGNCGKVFRFADSITKFHGWCAGKSATRPAKKKVDLLLDLLNAAHEKGKAAGDAKVPTPMTVVQRAVSFDDSSPVVNRWDVPSGVCGFAWVVMRGNSAIGRSAKKHMSMGHSHVRAHKGYPSGIHLWVHAYGQSMEQKEAYARAFAAHISEQGHEAWADSRMD